VLELPLARQVSARLLRGAQVRAELRKAGGFADAVAQALVRLDALGFSESALALEHELRAPPARERRVARAPGSRARRSLAARPQPRFEYHARMARARSNGIELEYEVIGNPADPALLLIMGLGAQLITWDDELVLGWRAAATS